MKEIDIAGRAYGLSESFSGNDYDAELLSDERKTYRVTCYGGVWTCTCKAQQYRRGEEDCKHIQHLRDRHERVKENPAMSEQQNSISGGILARREQAQRPAQPPAQADFNREQIDLIKRLVCKNASDDELALFLHQCKRTGLDPLSRQIHAVMRREQDESGNWTERLTVQTGIDGYWLIADRTGLCAGNDPTHFGTEFEPQEGVRAPASATVTIYKLVAGELRTYRATCRFAEYAARKRNGELTKFWREKPYRMLEKCAEAAALRKAFPQELSGVYTREEMQQEDEHEEAPRKPAESELQRQAAKALPATPAPRAETYSAMTELQAGRIDELRSHLELTDAVFVHEVQRSYGVGSPAALSFEQAGKLIERLERRLQAKRAQAVAPAKTEAAK